VTPARGAGARAWSLRRVHTRGGMMAWSLRARWWPEMGSVSTHSSSVIRRKCQTTREAATLTEAAHRRWGGGGGGGFSGSILIRGGSGELQGSLVATRG
jgi:hypothetical protein